MTVRAVAVSGFGPRLMEVVRGTFDLVLAVPPLARGDLEPLSLLGPVVYCSPEPLEGPGLRAHGSAVEEAGLRIWGPPGAPERADVILWPEPSGFERALAESGAALVVASGPPWISPVGGAVLVRPGPARLGWHALLKLSPGRVGEVRLVRGASSGLLPL